MIELYTWFTPNGRKISIMLEECGLPYSVHPVNIGKDEQHDPEFLKISPNNKIPAIVDTDNNLSLMESGAILLYLAEKSGQLAPPDEVGRWKMTEWLMFGQVHTFRRYGKGENVAATERYDKECRRLYGVMDRRLADNEYFLGSDYSIVDIAIFPWVGRWNWQEVDLNEFPNVLRWLKLLAARPAVRSGWNIPENDQPLPIPGEGEFA